MGARHGFTLLEVLVALLILSVGVMAVMQLFPASLYEARRAAERLPTSARAAAELGALRALGLSGSGYAQWPLDPRPVQTPEGDAHVRYNIQPLGVPDVIRPLNQTAAVYYLYRVTLAVPMTTGRYEKFVTYISKY